MQFYERALSQYNNADPKRKSYFDVAATLVLLIALVSMIYPAIQHISKLNREITAGKIVNKSLSDKIVDLNAAEASLQEVKSDLPLLEIALPTGSNIKDYLIKPLETLADRHSLAISTIQFTEVPISTPSENELLRVRDAKYTLTLSGDFVKFNAFLKDLEKFIRVTEIEKLDIKKSDSGGLTFTLTAITNYLGQPITRVPNQVTGRTQ